MKILIDYDYVNVNQNDEKLGKKTLVWFDDNDMIVICKSVVLRNVGEIICIHPQSNCYLYACVCIHDVAFLKLILLC